MALPNSCPDGDANNSQSICRTPEKLTSAGTLEEGRPAGNSNLDVMARNRLGLAELLSSSYMCSCALLYVVRLQAAYVNFRQKNSLRLCIC